MSKLNELKTVSKIVKAILEDSKRARENDSFLYYKVLEHIATQKGYTLGCMSVPLFFTKMKEYGFPAFETVRRTRQKIQHDFPELRATETVEQFRAENEQDFRKYAREGAVL